MSDLMRITWSGELWVESIYPSRFAEVAGEVVAEIMRFYTGNDKPLYCVDFKDNRPSEEYADAWEAMLAVERVFAPPISHAELWGIGSEEYQKRCKV
jgi:hypothetical protein